LTFKPEIFPSSRKIQKKLSKSLNNSNNEIFRQDILNKNQFEFDDNVFLKNMEKVNKNIIYKIKILV